MDKKKLKIALVSQERICRNMAGSAIRYYELSKVFSKYFDVTLFSLDDPEIESNDFKIKGYQKRELDSGKLFKKREFDYLISQNLWPAAIAKLKKFNTAFIVDLYDPQIIECLEYAKYDKLSLQNRLFDFQLNFLLLQLHTADHILCASDRQRDLYSGFLFKEQILNPQSYRQSDNLESYISLLPFGLSSENPKPKNPDIVYEKFPEIKKTDKIIYWGGGIWNWFDPISVIKAVENISKKRNDIKLIFLGTRHPNPKIKNMEMTTKALDYVKKNDLLDKFVFFNFGWTPYEERVDYLLSADIGISTHFDNFETHFSFRTRVLDYLWAELPMVLTTGDTMAELVEKYNLGETVEYQNVQDIETAILKIIENKALGTLKNNFSSVKRSYQWNNLIMPLVELITKEKISLKKTSFDHHKLNAKFFISGLKKKILK